MHGDWILMVSVQVDRALSWIGLNFSVELIHPGFWIQCVSTNSWEWPDLFTELNWWGEIWHVLHWWSSP